MLQLVRVMIAYNLTYQQMRSADGQYSYCLEPYATTTLHCSYLLACIHCPCGPLCIFIFQSLIYFRICRISVPVLPIQDFSYITIINTVVGLSLSCCLSSSAFNLCHCNTSGFSVNISFVTFYSVLLSNNIVCCNSNIEELIRFTDIKAHRQLTYGAKQLIAREVKKSCSHNASRNDS